MCVVFGLRYMDYSCNFFGDYKNRYVWRFLLDNRVVCVLFDSYLLKGYYRVWEYDSKMVWM